MTDSHHHADDHPELPVDSDIEASSSRRPTGLPRPLHIVAVAVGGAAGTLLRFTLATLIPTPANAFPAATFATNMLGAFALGVLLEAIAGAGVEERRYTLLRLLVGTGVLGGFTTYSTFAVEGARLLQSGSIGAGAAYIVATLALGLACSMAGIAVGGRVAWVVRGDRDADGDAPH